MPQTPTVRSLQDWLRLQLIPNTLGLVFPAGTKPPWEVPVRDRGVPAALEQPLAPVGSQQCATYGYGDPEEPGWARRVAAASREWHWALPPPRTPRTPHCWDCPHRWDGPPSPSAFSSLRSLYMSVRKRLLTRVDLPSPDSPGTGAEE